MSDYYTHIGIFGGTFDPPHISHTMACLYALETTDIERVMVIPCFQHPLGKEATSFEHRMIMTEMAMEALGDSVSVSGMESEREGKSYTVDTLRILRKRHPETKLSLIVGSDILGETREWKDFPEIEKLSDIIVLPRPGNESESKKMGKGPRFFLPEISSTEIRSLLREKMDVSAFLSRNVLNYIQLHKLYESD